MQFNDRPVGERYANGLKPFSLRTAIQPKPQETSRMTKSKTNQPILTPAQEMPRRLAACLAGVPAVCDQRMCRREGRCLGDGMPCFDRHGERIMAHLEAAAKDEQSAAAGDHRRS
jgi:hypothetical protein